ncbi:MAG: hypothetical protein P8N09_01540, partial [Planctomycetota bacterium]|nr:hypothetical protein [Planctomycetota bacterium]
ALPLTVTEAGPVSEVVVMMTRVPALRVQIVVESAGVEIQSLDLRRADAPAWESAYQSTLLNLVVPEPHFEMEVAVEGVVSGSYSVSLEGRRQDLAPAEDADGVVPEASEAPWAVSLASAEVVVKAGEPQFVRLEVEDLASVARIRGELISPSWLEVKPENCSAYARAGARVVAASDVTAAGEFTLTNVPPGEYRLVLEGASADLTRVVLAYQSIEIFPQDAVRDVVLAVQGSRLKVVRPEGIDVEAKFTRAETEEPWLDALLSNGRPFPFDADGVSEIYGLPYGNYTLSATDGSHSWDFTLSSGTVGPVVVVLSKDE